MIRSVNPRVVFLAALTILLFLAMICNARSHDSAEWIQRQQFKNAMGELCCGERDCQRLADGDTVPVNGGYLIRSRNEVVPTHQTIPASPDGYWICIWGGQRKCFFTPLLGS